MAKQNKNLHRKIMEELRLKLGEVGILTQVEAEAVGGSCYFSFADPRMGKCRIGDHDERGRYGYRWQIRSDITKKYTCTEKGHKRFFHPADRLDIAVAHMVNYQRAIENRAGAYNDTKIQNPEPKTKTQNNFTNETKAKVFYQNYEDGDSDVPF